MEDLFRCVFFTLDTCGAIKYSKNKTETHPHVFTVIIREAGSRFVRFFFFLIGRSARLALIPACVAESEVWPRPPVSPSHSPGLCSTWPLSERSCAETDALHKTAVSYRSHGLGSCAAALSGRYRRKTVAHRVIARRHAVRRK